MDLFLECCCTGVQSVLEAQAAGARRIELCERLDIGGVTPSEELVREVLGIAVIPVNVLIRPRGGDFSFDGEERLRMLESIRAVKELGAAGVVIGALTPEGNVDMPLMREMIAAARPMSITFHRAFDVCASPLDAFEDVIALGCDRLLTSGHEASAPEGGTLIAELVRRSSGRIKIMAGCGVRPGNIRELAGKTSAHEYHSSVTKGWA